jgi:hypothetical protein
VWDVPSTDEVEDGIVIAKTSFFLGSISERKGEVVGNSDRVNGFKLSGTKSRFWGFKSKPHFPKSDPARCMLFVYLFIRHIYSYSSCHFF